MLQHAGMVGAPRRDFRAVRAFFGRCLALLAAALLLLGWQAAARAEAEFLDPEKAFVFSAAMAAPDTLEMRYRVAPGYYMYRERFGITISPIGAATLGEAVYPKGEVKYDPTFEKDMEVFHEDVVIRVPIAAGGQPFTLTLTGQGCADAGLCYPPMDSSVKLTPVAGGYALAGPAGAPAGASRIWLTTVPPFCASPVRSSTAADRPSRCAAIDTMAPMVMTPVPPMPATSRR